MERHINRLKLVGVILIILLFFGGGLAMFGMKKEEFWEKYFVEVGASLEICNKMGSISIIGWEKDHVEVKAIKQSPLGLFFNDVIIEIKNDNKLQIQTVYKNHKSKIVGVEYLIKVPNGTKVDFVDNLNGRITIKGVEGDIVVQTSKGEIVITDVDGSVSAVSDNGAIMVSGANGICDVRSRNGSVSVSRISGDVRAQTSKGAINITDITGFANAKSTNGEVSISKAGCIKSVHTQRGNISVEVAAINKKLEVSTQRGKITLYLSTNINALISANTEKGNIIYEGLALSNIETTNNSLSASIGEGREKINIRNASGSIVLKGLQ